MAGHGRRRCAWSGSTVHLELDSRYPLLRTAECPGCRKTVPCELLHNAENFADVPAGHLPARLLTHNGRDPRIPS